MDIGTTIINADKIENEFLVNASLTKFDDNFKMEQNIIAEKINIQNKEWVLYNVIVTELENLSQEYKEITLKSNFDLEKINNLFSDLSSLSYFELLKLQQDYKAIGYSTDEIEIQKHRFYSLPFLQEGY